MCTYSTYYMYCTMSVVHWTIKQLRNIKSTLLYICRSNNMFFHIILLISLTSTTSFWKQLINQCDSCMNSHHVKLFMAYKPITYRKVDIMSNDPLQLLVNDKESSIINEVKSWKSYDTTEEQKVNEWIERGLVFWSSSDGVQSIQSHEQRLKPFSKASRRFKPQVAADMYVNRGTER